MDHAAKTSNRPARRRADTRTGDPRNVEVTLPDPDVVQWAAGVASETHDPIELAHAFIRDLSTRLYSLDTSSIQPQRPIASFLEGAPGHCEYFASAMALGLRLRGVSARVVGGYLGADESLFGGRLVVRESRAHLWVEAWIPGRGWTSFDPTPPDGRFLTTGRWPALRSVLDRATLAWDAWVVGLDMGTQIDVLLTVRDALRRWRTRLVAWGSAAAALILAGAVTVLLLRRRKRRPGRGLPDAVPGFYRRFLALAARSGMSPAESETAAEFAARAADTLGDRRAVAFVSGLYERQRFGGVPLSDDEIARAGAALGRLAVTVRRSATSSGYGRTSPCRSVSRP